MDQSLTMYTTSWCGYCRRTKAFLDQNEVPYQEINIEDDEAAAALVMHLNKGLRTVPTLVRWFGPHGARHAGIGGETRPRYYSRLLTDLL